MKIGFYCESPVDQAAMAVFTEGILGEPLEPINRDLEARTVPAFFNALGGVYRGVYYNSDAEGIVFVVDCDRTDVHELAHDTPGTSGEGCRLCQIRKIIAQAQRQLKPRQGKSPLKVAVGLTVPTIEAWYLVGRNRQVGEAAWCNGLMSGRLPFTASQLKKEVYGEDRPSLERKMECAVREARRIIHSDINAIETAFPIGFGLMASEIRSWKTQRPP